MRRTALFAGIAALATPASVAFAQSQQPNPSPLTISGTNTVSKGTRGGKPVPVSIATFVRTGTKDGSRPEGWKDVGLVVPGVTSNGAFFPKCDINKFAAAQSPSACPKGSLISTGKLTAIIGPANDFSNGGAPCKKDVSIYNAGQGKVISYLSGPGADCAGVAYQPPFPGTLKTSNGTMTLRVPIPADTISRPLPGVLGSPTSQRNNFKKLTVRRNGVTRGFFESTCKKGGSRKVTSFVVGDPSDKTYSLSTAARKC